MNVRHLLFSLACKQINRSHALMGQFVRAHISTTGKINGAWIVFLAACFFSYGYGQSKASVRSAGVTAEARTSKSYLLPGDHFTYSLEFHNFSPSAEISTIVFENKDMILLKQPTITRKANYAKFEYKLSIELPGDYVMPIMAFSLAGKSGRMVICGGNIVQVEKLVDEKLTPADIVDIEPSPFLSTRTRIILAVFLGVLILAVSAFFLVRAMRKKRPQTVSGPPPDVLAMQTLRELEKSIADDTRLHDIYYQVSYCLRQFLGRSLNLFILESTTAEIKALFDRVSYNPKKSNDIVSLLSVLDTVKYALAVSSLEERQKVFERAYSVIVQNTMHRGETGTP